MLNTDTGRTPLHCLSHARMSSSVHERTNTHTRIYSRIDRCISSAQLTPTPTPFPTPDPVPTGQLPIWTRIGRETNTNIHRSAKGTHSYLMNSCLAAKNNTSFLLWKKYRTKSSPSHTHVTTKNPHIASSTTTKHSTTTGKPRQGR